jgi:hypothetical protein
MSNTPITPRSEHERLKFPELKIKDGANNYGPWATKAQSRLVTLDLWEVVGGNKTSPPNIPDLRPPQIIRGNDANGQPVEIHTPGNELEHNIAVTVASPW